MEAGRGAEGRIDPQGVGHSHDLHPGWSYMVDWSGSLGHTDHYYPQGQSTSREDCHNPLFVQVWVLYYCCCVGSLV